MVRRDGTSVWRTAAATITCAAALTLGAAPAMAGDPPADEPIEQPDEAGPTVPDRESGDELDGDSAATDDENETPTPVADDRVVVAVGTPPVPAVQRVAVDAPPVPGQGVVIVAVGQPPVPDDAERSAAEHVRSNELAPVKSLPASAHERIDAALDALELGF